MADVRKEGHNGHHDERTGSERVRSGFDRRKNWGESIENLYQRIDHRLSELVERGTERGREIRAEAGDAVERFPVLLVLACFAAGLLSGLMLARPKD